MNLIVATSNTSARAYQQDQTIHEFFEKQAQLTPDQIAISYKNQKLSYLELNCESNKLARYLQNQCLIPPLVPGTLIALYVEPSLEMVIGLLGILKAGCAYVPIDIHYPSERVRYMLEDTGCPIVLTKSHLMEHLHSYTKRSVLLDEKPYEHEKSLNLLQQSQASDLAYVIYTSGTTGQPKGVMITHKSVNNYNIWMNSHSCFQQAEIVDCSSSISFDATVNVLLSPLVSGKNVILGETYIKQDPCLYINYLEQFMVNLIKVTPSYFSNLLNAYAPNILKQKLSCLQCVIVGGEKASKRDLEKWMIIFPHCTILHHYGPTETTVGITSLTLSSIDDLAEYDNVPLGYLANNTQAFVLDESKNILPIGAIGELYIGGVGLARGYLHQPELTNERFIPNIFASESDKAHGSTKLYKTGDLVRWLPNKMLDYIGRNDFQVKIRGVRVELGEVEYALACLEGILQSLVLLKKHTSNEDAYGNEYLVAYYTTIDHMERTELGKRLASVLPHYMIPSLFIHLDNFPLTISGKIDRKALPEAIFKKTPLFVPPEHRYEIILAEIWKKILHKTEVGIHDNFFDLGGNSILLIGVYAQLPDRMKEKLKLVDLFTYPNIASIKEYLLSLEERDDAYLLSSLPFNEQGLQDTDIRRTQDTSQDIAIIGMSGRFVHAENLDIFWKNLMEGRESVTFYTDEELIDAGVDRQLLKNPNYVPAQSRLENIACFDAEFFDIPAQQAEMMDPQHRIFMECAWHALEDANYNPWKYPGDIGFFASCGQNNYLSQFIEYNAKTMIEQFSAMIQNKASFLTTKIAYKLHLTGPSMTIQTACSSALVAVHQACLTLLQGDCDMALAGGVSIEQFDIHGYLHEPGFILSKDGHCRPFDREASGTFPGQGAGIVVLKPLNKAIIDKDHIYAVIKATSINNDGHQKIGFTAPSVEKQAALIKKAHQKAGIKADDISYIETHGTATTLGDPIEIEALKIAFSNSTDQKKFCAIGSVKSNLGHLGDAAGVAGLIKTVLCLYHKKLVPTLHYSIHNKEIDFESSPFFVNTKTTHWNATHLRKAGVSSFGIGGTNVHLILEQAPILQQSRQSDDTWRIFTVSGHSLTTLSKQVHHLSLWLIQNPKVNMTSLSYTLQVARPKLKYNKIFISKNTMDLQRSMQDLDAPYYQKTHINSIIFIFSGKNKHDLRVGYSLYYLFPEYKKIIDDLLLKLQSCLSRIIDIDTLFNETSDALFMNCAFFVTKYAMAQFFIRIGIKPTYMIGDGFGEYVSACLAEVMSIDDAIRFIVNQYDHATDFEKDHSFLKFNQPVIHMISNITGAIFNNDLLEPSFWLSYSRQNCKVHKGLSILSNEQSKDTIFIDLSTANIFSGNEVEHYLSGLQKNINTIEGVLKNIGIIDAIGIKINWQLLYDEHDDSRVRLPSYPFNKTTYWIPFKKIADVSSVKQNFAVANATASFQCDNQDLFFIDSKTKLIGIFEKVLAQSTLNEEQDFFEMGGDSLMAIQLAIEIKNIFGCTVDLVTLEKISINTLYHYMIAQQHDLIKNDTVVILQCGSITGGIPLILIHPIGGDVYFYRELSRCFPSEQTIIAIRSPLLREKFTHYDSVENIATDYIGFLEATGIKPPYLLGGASFGGIVAFEMAQQINTKYAYTPSIVMMDSPSQGHLPKRKSKKEILEYLVIELFKDTNIGIEELNSQIGLDNKIALITERLKLRNWSVPFSKHLLHITLDVWQIHGLCMEKYYPNPYPGDVIFFSPQEGTISEQQAKYWRGLVHGAFHSFVVPGNHISMNASPNVSRVAEILLSLNALNQMHQKKGMVQIQ